MVIPVKWFYAIRIWIAYQLPGFGIIANYTGYNIFEINNTLLVSNQAKVIAGEFVFRERPRLKYLLPDAVIIIDPGEITVPDIAFIILAQAPYNIGVGWLFDVIRKPEYLYFGAVIPVQPVAGAEPHKALLILQNRIN
jgi:hypothetical protein